MTSAKVRELSESSWRDKIILNGKYKWEFLDEYTFSEFKKDENCPTFTSIALGNAFYDNRWNKAMLTITKSKESYSVALYIHSDKFDQKCYWNCMITVIDIERIR